MENLVRYFVSVDRAYRSEIALFREERVTAEYCAVIEAPEGTQQFFAVEWAASVSIWADMNEAFGVMVREKAQRMHSIDVMG